MSDYLAQLAAVVRATAFLSSTRFAWFGVASPPLPAAVCRVLPPATARHYLLYQLQGQLYRDFYRVGGASPTDPVPTPSLTGNAQFVAQLAAANGGQGGWEPGWQAGPAGGNRVVVRRAGLALLVPPAAYRLPSGADPGTAEVQLPPALPAISPGFYTALGDSPFAPADEPLVRLYWHVDVIGALRLVALATRRLNEARIPFRLKVVNDPAHFMRCDAAVLYVRKTDYAAVATVVGQIYPALVAHMRADIPALTKQLAPGLALAEDPGQGTSFGYQRCALLAEGLLRAWEARRRRPADQLGQITDYFQEAGIAVEAPFLQPGSRDNYAIGIMSTRPGPAALSAPAPPTPPAPLDRRLGLDIALSLGARLVRTAIWVGDHCNWIGAAIQEPGRGGAPTLVYRALGTDFYNGTSGIALFLAELGAVTRDEAVQRTARGALRQALAHAEQIPLAARWSLYTGWIGIALAALRLGQLDPNPAWIEQGQDLLAALPPIQAGAPYDVLGGRAGAILGLLVLAEALADPGQRQRAVQLGADLVAAAEAAPAGLTWPAPGRSRTAPPLGGLSHGAGGIGYALLELYRTTGDAVFRVAAEGAFAYEQTLFDPGVGNWPDLRPVLRRRDRQRAPFATYWCHGAPGIALTRLRAYEVLGDARYRDEAAAGVAATRQWVQAALTNGNANYSLCHGLAGNVEILLQAADVASVPEDNADDFAQEMVRRGTAQTDPQAQPWPCGVWGRETPGLFLGLAGIGLFYLRLYDPSIPSLLLIQRDMYGRRRATPGCA